MIHENKLQGFLDRVAGDYKPITADIFLTDYCNEKCRYCRFSHATGRYMKYEDFVVYAKRLIELGVKGFILTGGGEPSINPDFLRIAKYLEDNNIPYGVNTNMVKWHKIAPKFLKVSLDAGNPDTYQSMRGKPYFDTVIQSLKDYISYKRENLLLTSVGVQCVAMDKNNVIEFYNAIKDIDVSYIYFRPFENNKYIKTEQDVIDEIDRIAAQDSRVVKSFKFNYSNVYFSSCIGNWTVITVNCEGKVPYCCHRYDDVVGHILDEDILSKLRKHNIDTRTCESPCRLSGVNNYLLTAKVERDYCFL